VSSTWTLVLVVGLATAALKGLGPLLLGGKPLPPRLNAIVVLLAPALLAALVAINTVGGDRELVLDARVLGVAAGGVAIWARAPVLVVIVIAAVVTAGVRTLG
jgi:hypothetical protein